MIRKKTFEKCFNKLHKMKKQVGKEAANVESWGINAILTSNTTVSTSEKELNFSPLPLVATRKLCPVMQTLERRKTISLFKIYFS